MEKERLYRYFSGEASVDDEKEIMDWAEVSSDNYKTYLNERKLWNAVLVNKPPVAGEKTQIKKEPKKINLWIFTTAAASVVLLFLLSYTFFFTDIQDNNWQTINVPLGQRVQVILNDSTVVWLNSQSTLKFPSSFNSDIREVQLNGEGYFEVINNKKKPFVVRTSRYDITVLGTNFNVFAYDNKQFFEASLINGSVRVSSKNKKIPDIVLRQNEKITEIDGKLKTSQIENLDHFRWREGLVCFDGEPFGEMMEKLSLYFDINIRIDNQSLLEYSPTGKFRYSDGIDHVLNVLRKDVKFTYTRNYELNEIVIK